MEFSTYEKRVLNTVYAAPEREIHGADLTRRVMADAPTTRAAIKVLVKEGLLEMFEDPKRRRFFGGPKPKSFRLTARGEVEAELLKRAGFKDDGRWWAHENEEP